MVFSIRNFWIISNLRHKTLYLEEESDWLKTTCLHRATVAMKQHDWMKILRVYVYVCVCGHTQNIFLIRNINQNYLNILFDYLAYYDKFFYIQG